MLCSTPRSRIPVDHSFGNEEIGFSHFIKFWRCIIAGLLQRITYHQEPRLTLSVLSAILSVLLIARWGQDDSDTTNQIWWRLTQEKKRCREEDPCTPRDFPLCLTIQKFLCLILGQSLAIRSGMSMISLDQSWFLPCTWRRVLHSQSMLESVSYLGKLGVPLARRKRRMTVG